VLDASVSSALEDAIAPPSGSASSAAVVARTRPRATASATIDAGARADALAAELALLDRARSRLRSGDASGALAGLDAYEKNHGQGILATEATLLKIEALVLAGRKDDARTVAAPLLQRRAGDMTGDRARALLER
jgi:hypothetical protein